MKNIVIVGAGNVGLAAAKALSLSPDMELLGFLRREKVPVKGFENIPVATSLGELPCKPEGAVICLPSRIVESAEKELLERGIYTVDVFDIHTELLPLRERLDFAAKRGGVSAITGAGWDPGLDSVIRTLMQVSLPQGVTYTNFGPGLSMGHSAAVRAIPGVKDAISFTLPLGFGEHRRKIYAVLEENTDEHEVLNAILSDPYFEHDTCSVEFVKSVEPYFHTGHGVNLIREGSAAGTSSNRILFDMKIDNPSLTAQLLVSAMRACFMQKPGCYFMTEIPPKDFCFGNIYNLL